MSSAAFTESSGKEKTFGVHDDIIPVDSVGSSCPEVLFQSSPANAAHADEEEIITTFLSRITATDTVEKHACSYFDIDDTLDDAEAAFFPDALPPPHTAAVSDRFPNACDFEVEKPELAEAAEHGDHHTTPHLMPEKFPNFTKPRRRRRRRRGGQHQESAQHQPDDPEEVPATSGLACPCGVCFRFCPLCGGSDVMVPVCEPGLCAALCVSCAQMQHKPWLRDHHTPSDSDNTDSESDTTTILSILYDADSSGNETEMEPLVISPYPGVTYMDVAEAIAQTVEALHSQCAEPC